MSTAAVVATVFFPASAEVVVPDTMNMDGEMDLQIDMQRSLLAIFSRTLGDTAAEGTAAGSNAGLVRGRVVVASRAGGDVGAVDSTLQRALHALTDAVPIEEVTNALAGFRRARVARVAARDTATFPD